MAPAPFSVSTPLGPDVLRLTGFPGSEGISRLFELRLDLVADAGAAVAFDRLLGQPVTVTVALPDGARRYLSGLAASVTRGATDGVAVAPRHTRDRMAVVKVRGDGMLQLRAPASQVDGDGMLMAKGNLTMINRAPAAAHRA